MVPQNDTFIIAMMNAFAGTVAREMESYELGLPYLEQALVLEPYHGWAHTELARTYAAMGQQEKAKSHLGKALYTWAEADPDYREAREARELAAEWDVQGADTQ